MNRMKLVTARLFVIPFLLCSLMVIQAQAAAGDLDSTFGSGGKVVTSITALRDYVRRVRIQPDGKIVTLGCSLQEFGFFPQSGFITRHNPDGTVDTSFGTNGLLTLPGFLTDFVILPDGKMMTTGSVGNSIVLYRINSNGASYTTFATTNLSGYSDGRKILLQPDGKIVVAGVNSYSGLVVLRYNPDGQLDNSFGTNGISFGYTGFSANYWLYFGEATFESIGEALLLPDGKIIIAGSDSNDVTVVRLNTDGTFDGSFGVGGIITRDISPRFYAPNYVGGMVLQADGKIVINGQNLGPYEYGLDSSFILRLNENGTSDNSFGTKGVVVIEEPNEFSRGLASALLIQPNGKILTAGMENGIFALARYNTNGAIDAAFGTNGIITTPVGGKSGFDTIFSLALQPDGKLVAAGSVRVTGSVRVNSHEVGLARYQLDTGNAKTVGVFRPSNGITYLRNSNRGGVADISMVYGVAGDQSFAGDWNGDSIDSIGIYRNGVFYLRNTNTTGAADLVFAFGLPGDQPIAGDWNGDGIDSIGVYRPTTGVFMLRNSNTAGAPDVIFVLGNPGDVAIAGDWNGDGITTTGVFRPTNGIVYLKNTNQTGNADIYLVYGVAGDKPLAGDWDGDGIDSIGIYRGGVFYLRNSNTQGVADLVFAFGNPEDEPVAGDWDGLS